MEVEVENRDNPIPIYYEMVEKRDIGRGGQNLGIWHYVAFERPQCYVLTIKFSDTIGITKCYKYGNE